MDGPEIVRGALAEARPAKGSERRKKWPGRGQPYSGMPPGNWGENADQWGMPPDCPVIPLGVNDGAYWFLDASRQLRCQNEKTFGLTIVESLFGADLDYLFWAWPAFDKQTEKERDAGKQPNCNNFRAEEARRSLFPACHRKGIWDPAEKVRGRGAWRERDGSLLLHCGNVLKRERDDKRILPGEREGFVYPSLEPLPTSWGALPTPQQSPATELLELFRTWNWARPKVDPVLLLGFISASMLAGALDWRPSAYIVGGSAAGKSTLQKVIKMILGDRIQKSENATAAGIWQAMKQDSLAVAIDEFEARADSRQVKAVLELARISGSGGFLRRGGAGHQGTQFRVLSTFLFSSINMPPMESQDLNRIAMLALRKLPQDAKEPVIDAERLALIGRMLLRRIEENFHRLPAALEAYREELGRGGHGGRGKDVFGTLLACADLVIDDSFEEAGVPMGEDLTPWRDLLNIENMEEYEDVNDNWLDCLNHLLTVQVEVWRGGARPTIGKWIADYYDRVEGTSYEFARDELAKAGLGLIQKKGVDCRDDVWLAVPNNSPLVRQLFHDSKWVGEMGSGVWRGALRQGAKGELWETGTARINGAVARCTKIRLRALYGKGDKVQGIRKGIMVV